MSKPSAGLSRWSPLQELIFLDRYAMKGRREDIQIGDTVVVLTKDHPRYPTKEVGEVVEIHGDDITVILRSGERFTQHRRKIDLPLETHPSQMWDRMAKAITEVEEPSKRKALEKDFRWLLNNWRFSPGGRINAMLGTGQHLTAYNCYVIPLKSHDPQKGNDSRDAIFDTVKNMAEIMSRGGGVGINLSVLRPRLSYVQGVNGKSSGAVSWGGLYSFVTGAIEQGGSRRGALMLILDCWHPDVIEFINAKRDMGAITNANISVGLTDDFERALEEDGDWELVFPDYEAVGSEVYNREWDGNLKSWKDKGYPVKVYDTIKARDLWRMLVESAWASAEPGIVRMDYANRMSNSYYFHRLISTNPCAEQFLPAWGVCNLGHLNLPQFVDNGKILWGDLKRAIRLGVRFLDNVIDATPYFFAENERVQKDERRIGMGTMGLGEFLIKLGVRYGSPESIGLIDEVYQFIAVQAYLASVDLAKEKGPFPRCEPEKYVASGFMQGMPEDVRKAVLDHGIRNVCLLTQAPTGSTGTMVGTSTGIEPYYQWTYYRMGRLGTKEVHEAIVQEWFDAHPEVEPKVENLPDYFVTALELTPEEHVRVQATIQRWVDSSISKTTNCPSDWTVEQVDELYRLAWKLGCKGITIYRDKSRDEQVLNLKESDAPQVQDEPQDAPLPDDASDAGSQGEVKEAFVDADLRSGVNGVPWRIQDVPESVRGMTYRQKTMVGTARITVNEADGEPFETIIVLGKAGMDITADAEAIGRLISLYLRTPSVVPNRKKLALVAEQLRHIGGAHPIGFGPAKVLSLPDALAQAISRYLDHDTESGATPGVSAETRLPADYAGADLCPNCGSFAMIRTEGCSTCRVCGNSAC